MQIREKTTAKVFGKLDTFWTYHAPPSLAYCLSLSNSVGKLNAIKENFTNTFASHDVNILVLMIKTLTGT